MKKVVLLPMGDQGHIDALLEHLGNIVEAGREDEFAMLLPSAQLLHEYRHRLVRSASRRLNLTTFDNLVADALAASAARISGLSSNAVTEIIFNILTSRTEDLPKLGGYARSRGMARQLAYALGQLRRASISPEKFEAALALSPDPILKDVLIAWQDYQAFLRDKSLADIEEQYALATNTLAFIPWLTCVREVHVCWFFDFEPLQQEILDKLADTRDVTVWLPYKHLAHSQYVDETLLSLEQRGFAVRTLAGSASPLTKNLFLTPPESCSVPRVQGLAAPRLRQELELIARELKKLAVGGATPEDICLVVPDQRRYLPLLRDLYQEHAIELALPLITDLTSVPWVREVLAIWKGAAVGWDRDSLLTMAETAYIIDHLPRDYDGDAVSWAVISLGRDLRGEAWLSRLDREIKRLNRQLAEGQEWLQKDIEASLSLYLAARPGLEAWIQVMAPMQKALSPQGHCQLLQELLEKNASSIAGGQGEEAIRDQVALNKVQAAIQGYLSCCTLLERTAPIGPGQFVEEFSPWLEQDLSLERSNPGAVRILSPAQIRGMKCKYVFILGLNQGVFPRPAREHWLLDRVAQLPGLPAPARASLAQEKIFFHSCVAATQDRLYLSRLLPGVEQEAEASPFWRDVEALVEGGLELETLNSADLLPPLAPETITSPRQLRQSLIHALAGGQEVSAELTTWLRGGDKYQGLQIASTVEQRRESPLPWDNMDGVLCHSDGILFASMGKAVYSISRLEQYARCPFSFFARYVLGLEPAPQDVPEYSALDRGTLLHWLLEKFYTEFWESADVHAPMTIRRPLEALARQWLEEHGRDLMDKLWRLRAKDAVDMVQALISVDLPWLERTGLHPVLHEATFGLPGSPVGPVQPRGGEVRFHGKIDRIDVVEKGGETWAVVYDYKTSQEITQKDIIRGKSLQIPVYLAAVPALLENLGYKDVRVMGGGYYVIRKAKLAGGIWHREFTDWSKKRLGSLEDTEFLALEHTLADRAEELHRDILAGKFPPQPDAEACTYCDYQHCCRYDKNRFNLKKGGQGNATQS